MRSAAAVLATTVALGAVVTALSARDQGSNPGPNTLLNVSYDVGRELFADINAAFVKKYKADTGRDVTINQSHAGSSRQARAVLEGLEADVVTFNQVTDVQVLYDEGKLIAADWPSRLPNHSSPFYSLPAFLVRAGNPKNVHTWSDLARSDVKVVFPNPKTSGNGRYTYLAAAAWAKETFKNDDARVRDYLKKVFANVPVFDTGGRASTLTFVEHNIGDVLISFESEVQSIRKEFGEDKYVAVVPPVSLLAEFPVAVVDKVVDRRGSRALAEAYLKFLYTPDGQDIIARRFNRVNDPAVKARYAKQFPDVRLLTVEHVFGGWARATKEYVADGSVLDAVFVNR